MQYVKDSGWEIDPNAALEYGITFEKDPKTKHIYAKFRDGKNMPRAIQLTHSKNPNQFLALSTIARNTNVAFVRDFLGVKDFGGGARSKIPPEQRQTLNKVRKDVEVALGSPDRPDQIEMEDVIKVEESLQQIESGTQTDQTFVSEGSLKYRELSGVDRSLRLMRT